MNDERFQAVGDLLSADRSIAAAIVYGSAAQGRLRADSDLDIAILRSDCGNAEASMLERFGALGNAAGRDVHLTDLRAVDCALRRSIFAHGATLFDRSDGALKQLEHATAIEYVDWEHARRIIDSGLKRHLERVVGDRDLLRRKTAQILHHVARLRRRPSIDTAALTGDEDLLNSVLMDLQQAIQACVDLAVHACVDDKLGAPASGGEAFALLHRAGRIDAAMQQRLAGAAGLRNLIVHQYVEIDAAKILNVIRHDLADLERFAAQMNA